MSCDDPLRFEREPFMEPARIPEHGDARDIRSDLLKKLQALAGKLGAGTMGDPGHIAAGMREAGDEPVLDRVGTPGHNDRDCGGCVLGCRDGRCSDRHDDVHAAIDEFLR